MNIETFEVLELLSKTPGRLDKEKILIEYKYSEELKFLFETSFNPYLIYGVRDFKLIKDNINIASFTGVICLREHLINREIVGNEAKKYIEKVLSCNNELAIKWLEATFKKNIKCGVDTKTINKVWPGLIPVFEVGLCETFKPENYGGELPPGVWYLEPKFDGLRAIDLIGNKTCNTFKSRNGKELYNFDYIVKGLDNLHNMVLDGEVYAGNWWDTVSIVRSEKNTEGKDISKVRYYIFDMLTEEEWKNQSCKLSYEERKNRVWLYLKENEHLKIVDGVKVNSIKEAKEQYTKFLELGFEGAVLKEANSLYPFKRSKFWLKWKPFYSEDLKIVGYEEGIGRNKGRLGKFLCDYKGVIVGVGGGYSDILREKYWKDRDKMVGKIIEVKYWEETPDGSLRFPIFMRLREDK
jgi:DNA ligase 1